MSVTHLPTHHDDRPDGCLTAQELVIRAGITYRQMDYWTRTGILHPVTEATPGSGFSRYFTAAEAHVAATMKALMDDVPGLSPRKAEEIARHMAERGDPARLGRFTISVEWEAS